MKHRTKRVTASVITGTLIAGAAALGVSLPAQAATTPLSGLYDTSFVHDITTTSPALAVQADGKILTFQRDETDPELGWIVRLNQDGSRDLSFGAGAGAIHGVPGYRANVQLIEVDPDGMIYASGDFVSYTDAATHASNKMLRLHPDGNFDDTFHSVFSAERFGSYGPDQIRFTSENKIIVSTNTQPGMHLGGVNGIARLNSDGSVDETFNPDRPPVNGMYGTTRVHDALPNGDLLIDTATYYDGAGSHKTVAGMRITPDGLYKANAYPKLQSLVSDDGYDGYINKAKLLPNGKYLIVGDFVTINDGTDHDVHYIARLNADGSVDDSFNPGRVFPNNSVSKFLISADGKVTFEGFFTQYHDRPLVGVAQMDLDGNPDPMFNPNGTGFLGGNTVNAQSMVVEPDGDVVLRGRFAGYNDGVDHVTPSLIRLAVAKTAALAATLPAGAVNAAYTVSPVTNVGFPVAVLTLSGALPAGLTFDPATGELSGTPIVAGDFPITITGTNDAGVVTQNYTLTITEKPTLAGSLDRGELNVAYTGQITATGTGPIAHAITAGALPVGLTMNADGEISGSPTQSGEFTFTVTATNATGEDSKEYTLLVVEKPALGGTVPTGTVGAAYAGQITATGTIPITYAITDGALPAGIALSPTTGAMSGTPSTAGTYTFTVTGTNTAGTGSKEFAITVNEVPAVSGNLPSGKVNEPYAGQVTATGTGPFTYAIASGTLPDGLTLNPTTGAVTGTPTVSGEFSFDITATGAAGTSAPKSYTVTVADAGTAPVIDGTALVDGVLGRAYAATVTATGTGPITYAITAGTLPTGVNLDPNTGAITGEPTQVGAATFTVTATNSVGTDAHEFTITVNEAPILQDAIMPNGVTGTPLVAAITATGSGPIAYTVAADALPDGLSLDADTGAITGTPTSPGFFTALITATNMAGTDTKAYHFNVYEAPTLPTVDTLPAGKAGTTYQFSLEAFGSRPITYEITGGAIPAGVKLDPDTGMLSGTPTVSGQYEFAITATNPGGTDTRTYHLALEQADAPVLSGTLPNGEVGTDYVGIPTVSGTMPASFEITSGKLPDGVILDSATGKLTGVPTAAGEYKFTLTATNLAGSAEHEYSILVVAAGVPGGPATPGEPGGATAPGGTGGLALTGADLSWPLVWIAVLAMLAGVGLVAIRRKRMNRDQPDTE